MKNFFNYKPVRQTIFHDPENGKYGNCYPAVLCSLFGWDIEFVPHFFDQDDPDGFFKAEDFLKDRGIIELGLPMSGTPKELLRLVGQNHDDVLWSMSAVSPRDPRSNHVVICKGGEFLWDPHPDDLFLKDAREGTTWIYFYTGVVP